MISFPHSEVVLSKFLHLWRCFSGNELCLHQKLDVRLPCPDIFKGKSITFLFQQIKLIKKPSLYSGAFERMLFFRSEWKQRQRWKGSFLKRNRKAYTEECIIVESGGKVPHVWTESGEKGRPRSIPLQIWKFGQKSHFSMFQEQHWVWSVKNSQSPCSHSVGVPAELRGPSARVAGWVWRARLKATRTSGITWKRANISVVYDVNHLVGLIFSKNGLF